MSGESSSFRRALDSGFIDVGNAGYLILHSVRPKIPRGRYALLSKSGTGVSVNLEYLIQVGANAELSSTAVGHTTPSISSGTSSTRWPLSLMAVSRGSVRRTV